MPLGTTQQTVTTGANFIPEIWANQVIAATESNLVFQAMCWDWSDPVKGKGDTIHIPGVSNLTSNAKAANTQVTLNAPTEDVTNLLINRHDECSFLIEDILDVQSNYNLMKYYTDKAGYAIARQRDVRINNLVSGFSQVLGAAGVDMGDQQIRDSIEYLDLADAPMEDRNLVIYPDQKNALFAIEKYFRADFRGDGQSKVLTKGRFGEIYGVPVSVTTNIGTSTGARLNTMFQKEAIGVAQQNGPRTQSDYILEYLGNLVVVDFIYGEVETRDAFGVWIRS